MKKYTILLLTLSICLPSVLFAQGLKFAGMEQQIDNRTSYDVFKSYPSKFRNKLNISFDITFYPTSEVGYILRIKGKKDSDDIYNLFYDGQGSEVLFSLNNEGHYALLKARLDKDKLKESLWTRVSLSLDFANDSITLAIGDEVFSAVCDGLPVKYSPSIHFGRNEYMIDVPSFAIKNLSIGNGGRKNWSFALDELEGSDVHDERGKTKGKVDNPQWLMNEACNWKETAALSCSSVACAGYNSISNEICYFDRDSIYLFNIENGNLSHIPFRNRCPVILRIGTSFIDASHERIYAYETCYENLDDSVTVACLDLKNLKWRICSREQLPTQLHHHGTAFDPGRSRYVIFGGFGRQLYNGEFRFYDIYSDQWHTQTDLSGDKIFPRYFTSMAYDNQAGIMYLYGGMGNESGEQIVGRQYFYDLYSIDLNSRIIRKLWTTDLNAGNVVPVRNMVLTGDGHFYTMCYNESLSYSFLQMYRFSIEDGKAEVVANTIPIRSDKINTNANIYYDRHLEKMIVTVQEFDSSDNESVLKVYTLSMPKVSEEAIIAYYEKLLADSSDTRTLALPLIICALLLIAILVSVLVIIRKRRARANDILASENRAGGNAIERRHNAVYMFGAFDAIDNDGVDIAASFTQNPLRAFCLIMKYSVGGGGISSKKFSAVLWPDKTEDKVKNSRGVMLNSLRKTLSKMNGVEIVFENGCYRLDCSDGFYCDYLRFNEILSAGTVEEDIDEVISILSRGKFMAFSQDPVFDTLKERTDEKIETLATAQIKRTWEAKDYQTVIKLADIIFTVDPFNGQALAMLIRSLSRLKKHDESRLRYQTFATEYRKAYDADYPYSYSTLLSKNINEIN